MKIIIDAMGGDFAPAEIIKGALEAKREFGIELLLVGIEDRIRECLKVEGVLSELRGIEIVNAEEVITMEDDPNAVVRGKKDSSMAVSLRLLNEGRGDAVISAGNTGALLSGATLIVKRIKGIRRAALAPTLPNGGNGVTIIDAGASVDCTPEYLQQFAHMGSFYAEKVLGTINPKVGLLNIGTEDHKGTSLQTETLSLLRADAQAHGLNFVGNVEGSSIFGGEVDVLVCDGYSGNVLLKTVEGTASFMMGELKKSLMSGLASKVGAALMKGRLELMKKKLDPHEIGATALLGISKPVLKAHGSSNARAVRSAVLQAKRFVEAGVIPAITENIASLKIRVAEEADAE